MVNSNGGLCQCGCGLPTHIALRTAKKRGDVRGKPVAFLRGHSSRNLECPYDVQSTGFASDCWLWRGCKTNGYGNTSANGKRYLAHVLYWERSRGPVPQGKDLDHLCRQRSCVNPDHLEPVSRAINIRRGSIAKLNPTAVVEIRNAPPGSTNDLAARFGVHPVTICAARRGATWVGAEEMLLALAPKEG